MEFLQVRIKIIAIFFISLIAATPSFAQANMEGYVKQKSLKISTINPEDENFDDLAAIGRAIGEAQVVMLGEQGHGDGSTFLAKSRVIKYLHEKMGFDVLAFEDDFFALNEGWATLNKDQESINRFIPNNIARVWSGCTNCSYLFSNYLPNTFKTAKPLTITGIDCHQLEKFTLKNLPRMLDSVLKRDDLPITKGADYPAEISRFINLPLTQQTPDDLNQMNNCIDFLKLMQLQLTTKEGTTGFWAMVADNLVEQANDLREHRWSILYRSNGSMCADCASFTTIHQ